MAFSSIAEESRPEVISKCYWPLLRFAADLKVPLGIEASGYTLETIQSLDPDWVAFLKTLIARGIVTPIASGYAQLIGPLVPADMNAANYRIGSKIYEKLLGELPSYVLVNEQAYSAGMLAHYKTAGFKALIMEWDNPAKTHPFWKGEWRYLPQIAKGQHGEQMPVIWNNSIAFQKFQHFVHGELGKDEYLKFLSSHIGSSVRAFPLYGNDVEIFDFRPGRFHTEAALSNESEWDRIRDLYASLQQDQRFELVSLDRVISLGGESEAGNKLSLESAVQPIPVKKQRKYNITRWAVSGRDDLSINTRCWRLLRQLREEAPEDYDLWKELCFLWSSDFRTHITPSRWDNMTRQLKTLETRIGASSSQRIMPTVETTVVGESGAEAGLRWEKQGCWLIVDSQRLRLIFNCRRGLAIHRFSDQLNPDNWLFGTLTHGYFDDIHWSEDFFSGHLYYQALGTPEITDLEPVAPELRMRSDGKLEIFSLISTSEGSIAKTFVIDAESPFLDLEYRLDWKPSAPSVLRLGHIVLNPNMFDSHNLRFVTTNGGWTAEEFPLEESFDHGAPVSFLVSAQEAVGVTDGWVDILDSNHRLRVSVDKETSALIGMAKWARVRDRYLFSFCFSAREMDETVRPSSGDFSIPAHFRIRYGISMTP